MVKHPLSGAANRGNEEETQEMPLIIELTKGPPQRNKRTALAFPPSLVFHMPSAF